MKITKFLLFLSLLASFHFAGARGGDTSSTGSRGGGTEVALDFQTVFMTASDLLINLDENYSQKVFSGLPTSSDNYSYYFLREVAILVADETNDNTLKATLKNKLALLDKKEKTIYLNRDRWTAIENFDVRSALALHLALSLYNYENPKNLPFTKSFIQLKGLRSADIESHFDPSL